MSIRYGAGAAFALVAMCAFVWLSEPRGDGSVGAVALWLLGFIAAVAAFGFCATKLIQRRIGLARVVLVDLNEEDDARLDAWLGEMNRHNPDAVGRGEALRVLAMAYAKEHVGELEPAP